MFLHKPREEDFVKVVPLQKVISFPTLKHTKQYGMFLDPEDEDAFCRLISQLKGKFTTLLKLLTKTRCWEQDPSTLLSYIRQLHKQRKNPLLTPDQRVLID